MKTALLALLALALPAIPRLAAQTPAPSATATVGVSATGASGVTSASVTKEDREEATGTITELTPDRSLILNTKTDGTAGLTFRFAPKVTYVDSDGETVQAPGLRKNLRVRVSYVKTDGDNVIDKVTIVPQ